jgi:hypothetical protein
MAYKYKNITEYDLVVPNVGEVKAGETITSDEPLESSSLELVSKKEDNKDEEDSKSSKSSK